VVTPLPPIDTDQVARFWTRFLAAGLVDPSTPLPETVEPFGDSAELADELVELVVNGPKRATAGALIDYELEGAPLPQPGTIWIVTDGAGRARAVLCTTEVRIGPLTSVDESFAWDEGEGERTREWWLAAHQEFFRRCLPHDRRRFRSRCGHGVRAVRHAVRGVTPRTCSTTSEQSSDLKTVRHVPAAPGHADAPIWGGLGSPSLVSGVTVWVACDPRVRSEGHTVACRVFRQGPSTSR
jgi:uncharacterized protein YhfF